MSEGAAKEKYMIVNEQKELTSSSSSSFSVNQFDLQEKLKLFNASNQQAAVAGYNADLLITVALFLMVIILLFIRLFSLFDFRELQAYFCMFGISILLFGLKTSIEQIMKTENLYGQAACKVYDLDAKSIDVCLFVVAWIAPIEQIAGFPILNYVLTIPVLYVLWDILSESSVRDNSYYRNKFLWCTFVGGFIITRLVFPAWYEGQNISVLHFFAIYDIWSAVCQFPKMYIEGRPKNKQQVFTFLYNHANNSIGLRIATLPMFSRVPLGFMFGVLAQAIICLFFRLRQKQQTIVVKFLSRRVNTILKLRSNRVTLKEKPLTNNQEHFIQKVQRSAPLQDFSDQLCCMCNQERAQVVIVACSHCYSCVKCIRKQRRKGIIRCPICKTRFGNQLYRIGEMSSKDVVDSFLGEKFNGMFLASMYGYTGLAL